MQVPSAQLPSGGGASASNAPAAESTPGVRIDKRKAEVLGQQSVTPVAPGPEEVVDTGVPAPWKSQRKRQKRPRGESGVDGGEGAAATPAQRTPPPAPPVPPVPPAPGSPALAPTTPSPASAAKSRPGALRKPGGTGPAQGSSLAAYNQALLGT
mmetsp:Transcript_69082/g.120211  ORF Transcript_69082/g.120211 Transcript_69082/m.120211 type:complete len:154 (+) Transcript_69082:1-462(+)